MVPHDARDSRDARDLGKMSKRPSDAFEQTNTTATLIDYHLPGELWIWVLVLRINEAWSYDESSGSQIHQIAFCQRVSKAWLAWTRWTVPRQLRCVQWDALSYYEWLHSEPRKPLIDVLPAITCLEYYPCVDDSGQSALCALVTPLLYELTNLTALRLTLDREAHRLIDVPDLRRLSNLRSLSLQGNSLITAPSLAPLAASLTELDLTDNTRSLPISTLRGFTALRSLTLINTGFNLNTSITPFVTSLTHPDVRGSYRPDQSHQMLQRTLVHYTNLTSLTLHASDFGYTRETLETLVADQLTQVTRLNVTDRLREGLLFPRQLVY